MIVKDRRGKNYDLDKQIECIKLAKFIERELTYYYDIHKGRDIEYNILLKVVEE